MKADGRGPLGDLVDSLAAGKPPHDAFPEMPALEEFRRIWSNLRARGQLRQSLAETPTDAGPLNSAKLVHRMLTLMRDSSPGYLRHFLSYADTLSCLEQMRGAADARPPSSAKRKRGARGAG